MHRAFTRKFAITATIVTLAASSVAACGNSQEKPSKNLGAPSGQPTEPPPTYTAKQVQGLLINAKHIGPKWKTTDVQIDALKKGKVLSCSISEVALKGSPELVIDEFGAPNYLFTGANFARLIAVYDDPPTAASSFNELYKKLAECPAKQNVPATERKDVNPTKDKEYYFPHKDTWKLTEGETSGWRHVRAVEEAVTSPSISRINLRVLVLDYALRGNVIFTSYYWQRLEPDKKSKPLEDKATELLGEQLRRFG
ncbi:hypothetical protein LO762_01910 [Actinocorallia sp. API 0066]|uniref:hypothetical protein n=1 Tax=Actinocorallia sp. API 0066 TaxID=2896846 RepID=UPI001E3A848E|nr:hypothetical protein [Actinocorallia sp. API 0066]MCD0447955.1 hypothetical protein [Actinocorallia sp. API 0066]